VSSHTLDHRIACDWLNNENDEKVFWQQVECCTIYRNDSNFHIGEIMNQVNVANIFNELAMTRGATVRLSPFESHRETTSGIFTV
jgi:hypothetical protein